MATQWGCSAIQRGAFDGHAQTNDTTIDVESWNQQTQQTETTEQGLKVDGLEQQTGTETETTKLQAFDC
jgi:hypothetical protein